MDTYVNASDGKPIRFSRRPAPYGGVEYGHPVPTMERDIARADTTITVGEWELSYDSRGYCYKRIRLHR